MAQNFRGRLFSTITQRLCESGFQKRQSGVLIVRISNEIVGWVGLNTAFEKKGEILRVNPVIGVRHQRLEAFVAELLGLKMHPYIPPSIASNVGYLTPQKSYVAWSFSKTNGCETPLGEIVGAIEQFGRPFMQKHGDLRTLYDTMCDSGLGIPHELDYRVPAAAILLNKPAEAEAFIDAKLREIGNRDDAAAQWFRNFAKKLTAHHS
jgi:hypothetical protein